MKLLFATDHRFEVATSGEVFTLGGKYPYSMWAESYLRVFEDVRVIGRGGAMTSEERKLSTSTGANVSHRLLGSRRGAGRILDLFGHAKAVKEEVSLADVIVARLPGELGQIACQAARAMGKPYMIEVVASAWDGLWNHGYAAARLYAPVLELRTKGAVRSAPIARYVTEEFLQRAYPTNGRAFVASNVALEPIGDGVLDARHRRLQKQPEPLVFGTIGSLVSRMKGVHTALEALASLQDRLPAFQYRVLGEGDPSRYRQMAEEFGIADRVFFDGVLPGGAPVAAWLDGVDLYLQPSLQEGLPRALIEAMSRGALAIASTVGGNGELLPAQRLHRPNDAVGLAHRIRQVVDLCDSEAVGEATRNFGVASRYQKPILLERRIQALAALRDLA